MFPPIESCAAGHFAGAFERSRSRPVSFVHSPEPTHRVLLAELAPLTPIAAFGRSAMFGSTPMIMRLAPTLMGQRQMMGHER
jgi:hypothetical protein